MKTTKVAIRYNQSCYQILKLEVCVLLVQHRICILIPRLSLLCPLDHICEFKRCQESRLRELGNKDKTI